MSALRVPWSQRPKPIAKPGFLDPALRRVVFNRAGGRCECCGDPVHPSAYQCHHRKLRSRGGLDSACNLACLCAHCHRRLHSHVTFATEHGFIVSATDDPAVVPMLINLTEPFYLTSDGSYSIRPKGHGR